MLMPEEGRWNTMVNQQIVYLDVSGLEVPSIIANEVNQILSDALSKAEEAFSDTHVQFVYEQPESGDYSTLYLNKNLNENVGSPLGLAEHDITFNPNDFGYVSLNNLFRLGYGNGFALDHISNMVGSTIAHEIGHLMGLDHSNNPNDLMHDGLTENMLVNPPAFNTDQLNEINYNATIANNDIFLNLEDAFQDLDAVGFGSLTEAGPYEDLNDHDNDFSDDVDPDVEGALHFDSD